MNSDNPEESIENYKFHHIDVSKCKQCTEFSCEDACMRNLYKVINKDTEPKAIFWAEHEDFCVKCHICTTACKLRAITID